MHRDQGLRERRVGASGTTEGPRKRASAFEEGAGRASEMGRLRRPVGAFCVLIADFLMSTPGLHRGALDRDEKSRR